MKRTVSKLLALVMALCMMSGALSFASAEAKSDFEGQVLTLGIFQGGYGNDFWNDVVAKFKEEYGVVVEMTISPSVGTQIQPRIAAGNAPDFLSIPLNEVSQITKTLMTDRQLMPLDDVFESECLDKPGTLIKDAIFEGILDSKNYRPYDDEQIYFAPFNVGPMGMIYNKALFAEKGWELPKTWDDFFALGDIAKEEGYALFTYAGEYPGYLESMLWPAIAAAGGGEQAVSAITQDNAEGSFSTPEVRAVLENIRKIAEGEYMLKGTPALNHTDSQAQFLLNKALFIPNGTWIIGEMAEAEKAEGFEYGLTYAPTLNVSDDAYVMSSDEQFCIPIGAKNPELAKEFLRFLYTDYCVQAFTKYTGSLMSVKGARGLVADVKKDGTDELAFSPELSNMYEVFDSSKTLFVGFSALPVGSSVNLKTTIFKENVPGVMTLSRTVDEWISSVEDAMAQARADIAAQ